MAPTAPGPRARPATPGDVPQILGLIHELAEYERAAEQVQATAHDIAGLLFGTNTPSGSPAAFCHVVASPEGEATGDPGQDLVGMALWFLTTSTWTGTHGIHIEDLYVRPQFRGRGFGAALMAELAGLCLRRGYRRLEWAVLDWNSPAIAFYQALGSQPMAEWTTMRLSGPALQALADRRGARAWARLD